MRFVIEPLNLNVSFSLACSVPGGSSDPQAPGKMENGKILAQPQVSLPNGNQGQTLQKQMYFRINGKYFKITFKSERK